MAKSFEAPKRGKSEKTPKGKSDNEENYIESASELEYELVSQSQEMSAEQDEDYDFSSYEESMVSQEQVQPQQRLHEPSLVPQNKNSKTKPISKSRLQQLVTYLKDLRSVLRGRTEGFEDHFKGMSKHFKVEMKEILILYYRLGQKKKPVEKVYLNPENHKDRVRLFQKQIAEITQSHLFSTLKSLCKHLKVYNREECDAALVKKALDNLNYDKNEKGHWVKTSYQKPDNAQFSLSTKKILQNTQRNKKPILHFAEYMIQVPSNKSLRLTIIGGPEGMSHKLDKQDDGGQFCEINIRTIIIDHAKKYNLKIDNGLFLTIGHEEVYGKEMEAEDLKASENKFMQEVARINCKAIIFPEGMRNLSPFYGLKCELQRVLNDPKYIDRYVRVANSIISKSEAIEDAKTILGINYRQINDAPVFRLR